QACIASLPLQSSLVSKTHLKSDHLNGGGSEPLSSYLERWKAPTSAVTRHGKTIYVSGFPPFDPATREFPLVTAHFPAAGPSRPVSISSEAARLFLELTKKLSHRHVLQRKIRSIAAKLAKLFFFP